MRLAAAMLFVTGGLIAVPSAAKDTWISLQSGHLTIVSHASESAARDMAGRLTDFVTVLSTFPGRQLISDVPLTVIALRNDRAFAPFKPRQNGRTLDVAGFFQRADDENFIALSLDTTVEYPYRVLLHEYAHALTAQTSVVWPLWLSEGLAEFYSTFEVYGDRAFAGQRINEYARLVRDEQPLPLSTLFAIDRSSPMYGEGSRNIFYAESWALVQYLMSRDGMRPGGAFFQFIAALRAGQQPDNAFDAAFGSDRAVIEAGLRRFILQGRFAGTTVSFNRRTPASRPAVRVLSEAEAEVVQGNLLMRVGRGDDADAYFARARALDPDAPRLEESRGFLALNRGQYAEALGHLSRAIAQDPSNALAHYYYAETLRRQVTEHGDRLTPAVAGAMADPLRTAVRLMPGFARAHYVLGYVQLVMGQNLEEAVRLLETAIHLAPPNRAAMLTLASLHLKMGNPAAAKETAQALIDAPDASEAIKAEARVVLAAAGTTGRSAPTTGR